MGRHRTLSRLAALAVASAVVQGGWCEAASAGTVRLEHHVVTEQGSHGPESYSVANIIYEATPGETNDVTLTSEGRGAVVHDDGALVTAGNECQQLGAHDARCSVTGTDASITGSVQAGDADDHVRLVTGNGSSVGLGANGGAGDDSLSGALGGSSLDGGPGNDALTGGDGPNSLRGGPGDDTLVGGASVDDMFGGAGTDTLTGGSGNDVLRGDGGGAPPAPDFVDGGPGADTIAYTDRSIGVNVDLERPDGNGQPGENDRVVDVENAMGGAGSDRLAGDDGRNFLTGQDVIFGDTVVPRAVPGEHDVLIGRRGADVLDGSPGSDLLVGGPGNDGLASGQGHDRLLAGPGDDILDLLDGRPDALGCGSGNDYVEDPVRTEVVPGNCDTVAIEDVDVSTHVRRVGRAVLIAIRQIPDPSIIQSCRARVRLVSPKGRRGHRESLGVGTVRLRVGHRHNARIALTQAGWRALSAGRHVKLEVQLRGLESCNPRSNVLNSPVGAFTLGTKVAT